MGYWAKATASDFQEKDEPLKGPHRFQTPRGMAWLAYCARCGHVALKNRISCLVSKIGCGYELDARFKAWKKNPGKEP